MGEQSLRDWLLRIKAGDRAAWKQLDDYYRPRLIGYARQQLSGNPGIGLEDVVQIALWKTWMAIDGVIGAGNPEAYIFAILRNVINEERRKTTSHTSTFGDEPDPIDGTPSPPANAEQSEEAQQLNRYIAKLEPKYRIPLLLKYEGKTYAEISQQLGINPEELRNHVAYGMKKLRSAILRKFGIQETPDG